jgi:dinuclear metal center YbgI/SA1388 family protein
MQRQDLTTFLDTILEPWRYKDYAPNGLQVEGGDDIRKVITGVTASQALINAALEREADAILVHHGYFWKNEDARIVGIKQKRLKALLLNDINLYAYHLPLDGHLTLGNNAQLAEVLGLIPEGQGSDQNLLWFGRAQASILAEDFCLEISQKLGREALLLGPSGRVIKRVAWCTGGAQSFFADAIALGVDAFITGEVSEPQHHLAEETGTTFIAAGHHATERFGIRALGRHLADATGLEVEFIDIFNPV